MLIQRKDYIKHIDILFRTHKAVALLGARQCGKTTLARMYAEQLPGQKKIHRFDLENPVDLARLENPMLALKPLAGLIVIDEIQRRPDLFPILRVLIDDETLDQSYLILGSASQELNQQSSDTLAGRIGYIEVFPFSLAEVSDLKKLFLRGGFPRSYLADTDMDSFTWRDNYIRTYLERDIPALGIRIPPTTIRRFWMMLSHYNGQLFNGSAIATSMGLSDKTIKSYLDILVGTFMIRQLQPWHVNIAKRQVKRAKLYFRDSGIFHALLGLSTIEALETHPLLGSSWESFALEQIISSHGYTQGNCYFWGVHGQAELDLLVFHQGKKIGYEFKYTDAPRLTKAMVAAQEILELDQLFVIYPGEKSYTLAPDVEVLPL